MYLNHSFHHSRLISGLRHITSSIVTFYTNFTGKLHPRFILSIKYLMTKNESIVLLLCVQPKIVFFLSYLSLGICSKLGPRHCCFSWTKPTNQGTLHPLPSNSLVWTHFNESWGLWMFLLRYSVLKLSHLPLSVQYALRVDREQPWLEIHPS